MEQEAKIFKTRPIKKTEFSKAGVDILIPFHGLYVQTRELVQKIVLLTKSNPYQICLIDDFSPNKHFIEKMKEAPQVKALRTPDHLGFGGALEYGFNQTEQPWVIIMHNDCMIYQANWMLELGQGLIRLKDQNVGMIAPKEKADGKDEILEDQSLPLNCVMCHRSLFSQIGGFIKNYYPMGYEDEELAYRMKKHGYKQAYCGSSWVKHNGALTEKFLVEQNSKYSTLIDSNRDKCIEDIKKL